MDIYLANVVIDSVVVDEESHRTAKSGIVKRIPYMHAGRIYSRSARILPVDAT